jgi:hypothetical protein
VDRLQLRNHRPHAPTLLLGQKFFKRPACLLIPKSFPARALLAAHPARVRAQRIQAQIECGPVDPSRGILRGPLFVKFAESFRGEFFGLAAIAGESYQGLHQSRIVFDKKLFESALDACVLRRERRPEALQNFLATLLHTD